MSPLNSFFDNGLSKTPSALTGTRLFAIPGILQAF
jgi:hypothetical protein